MEKRIFECGCIVGILYFVAVGVFLVTKTDVALTIWEVLTMLGAVQELIILLEICHQFSVSVVCRNIMIAFMSCTCALTGVAHFVNMTVTRPLIQKGVDVPTYFQIGCWPSVEMAIDYLAWGFFAGFAFLSVSLGIARVNQLTTTIKKWLFVCGVLCLTGFTGTVFVNDLIWYVAPMGYGAGIVMICFRMRKGV